MDVRAKLAQIRQVVEQARSMPMSASAVVNRAELLALVDEASAAYEEAMSESSRLVAERDHVLERARSDAGEIVEDARKEQEKIVSDTEVFRIAKRQADELLAEAREEAAELRRETDEYVDGRLANFEITLERTIESVKRGRERLAGRSALDSLTTDEADKIRLPSHLEP